MDQILRSIFLPGWRVLTKRPSSRLLAQPVFSALVCVWNTHAKTDAS